MSGHNKWSKIKRNKASNDAKRGAVFTRLGNQIALAARQGVDPQTNNALALAIDSAKSFNMPQSTIQRAIQRASDRSAAQLEEVVYEGYGGGGLAILVACATDNRRRTYPEVKATFAKHGGNIAEPGSVIFNFQHCGEILIQASGDEVTLQILDCGASDVLEVDDTHLCAITEVNNLHQVITQLKAQQLVIEHADLSYRPKVVVDLDDKGLAKATKLINALEDLDDTLDVYTNLAQTSD